MLALNKNNVSAQKCMSGDKGLGGKNLIFYRQGYSSENFHYFYWVVLLRGSGRFQALKGTIQKRTCRQNFKQFNEAKMLFFFVTKSKQ